MADSLRKGIMLNVKCPHCSNEIQVSAEESDYVVACPICGKELTVQGVGKPPVVPASRPATPAPSLSIGDILVRDGQVITPNGSASLADSQWIFTDMAIREVKIPTYAIILAVIFFLACLLGLLFLLMKERTIRGYAEITVMSGNLVHKIQLPVSSESQINHYRTLVAQAQSFAAQSRSRAV